MWRATIQCRSQSRLCRQTRFPCSASRAESQVVSSRRCGEFEVEFAGSLAHEAIKEWDEWGGKGTRRCVKRKKLIEQTRKS
ncbi:hypothetical protein TB1_029260 [Malus domestica]